MRVRTFLVSIWAVLSWLAPAKAAGPMAAAIVLDCSKSMSAPMAANGADANPAFSRLDVAKDALQAALTKFAERPDRQAAVWLFGHRLAWDEGDTPELLEQTEYLEQTLGFGVLQDLMPGDDVELVRPMASFDPQHVEMLAVRIEKIKPWGEDPLYLSLVRCLDATANDNPPANTSLVVITDGGNRQGLARNPTRRNAVLAAYDRHSLPIHFILLGDGKNDRQVEAEFKQLADRSGGSYGRSNDGESLARALEAALQVDTPPEEEPLEVVGEPAEPEDEASENLSADMELADAEPGDDEPAGVETADAAPAAGSPKPAPAARRVKVPANPLARTDDESPEEGSVEAAAAPAESLEKDPGDPAPTLRRHRQKPSVAKSRTRPRTRANDNSDPPPAKAFRLHGLVTCYGKPVKKAKLTLLDTDLQPVATDKEGRFEFRDVPPGEYKLACEAVVRNMVRQSTTPVRLSQRLRVAKALDVKLE